MLSLFHAAAAAFPPTASRADAVAGSMDLGPDEACAARPT